LNQGFAFGVTHGQWRKEEVNYISCTRDISQIITRCSFTRQSSQWKNRVLTANWECSRISNEISNFERRTWWDPEVDESINFKAYKHWNGLTAASHGVARYCVNTVALWALIPCSGPCQDQEGGNILSWHTGKHLPDYLVIEPFTLRVLPE
jgi:hypothetical protein